MTSTKMDEFTKLLPTQEIRKKLNVGNDILNYLSDPKNSIECSDIGLFIDNTVPWLQNSNPRVAQNGIEILIHIADRLGVDFRAYVPIVLASIIDRLGDSKENVRDKCKVFIMKLLEKDIMSPNNLFERLMPAFSHKNSNIREEVMKVLVITLNEYGPQSLTIIRLVPSLVKLISDPSHEVRETANNTMTEVYKHVGEKLKTDLQKNYKIPQNKLTNLFARFDQVKNEGELLPSVPTAVYDEDEADKPAAPKPRKIFEKRLASSYTARMPPPVSSYVPPVGASSIPTPKGGTKPAFGRRAVAPAGAVDEDSFQNAFEDVPSLPMVTHKELDSYLKNLRVQISTGGELWEKRVDAMKRLRAIILSGTIPTDELITHIRNFDIPLETALKDLRSQVVREACITVAFLSQHLQQKFDHSAEFMLSAVMGLIQNSAKVISSSGLITLKYVLTYTHAPRLIPILVGNLTSKSREIRRASCECLDLITHKWNTHSLERHIPILQDAIKKGLSDADAEARTHARKSYYGFKKHFPEQAEALLNNLDLRCKQKLLEDAPGNMSNSSSTNSIHQSGIAAGPTSLVPASAGQSRTPKQDMPSRRAGNTPVHPVRSNSAIDLQAAQRAKARAQYAAMARQKVGGGGSLPRARKLLPDLASPQPPTPAAPGHAAAQHSSPTAERVGRTRNRIAGVSQSQPSSRSGSPSSRLNYATYNLGPEIVYAPRNRTQKPFCRSTGTSRETSPNRYTTMAFGSKLRNRTSIGVHDRPPIHSTRPVMAQKILQQSREAESALADALSCDPTETTDSPHRVSPKRTTYKPSFAEDHSDDSETSSVCSERSDTFRRPSDSFSWSGSQQRLYRDLWEPSSKNVGEIIANCESTHWSDRKEGLVGLQLYFQNGNLLTPSELKRVTDNFTKMFMDSHTKVFSLFLDTLNELIIGHREDLNSWLYVLLTRLLNKLGADLLGSIQTKIHKSLEVVRESFPCELQMLSVLRFLVDATQTPNARVKTAALNYVTKLAAMTDPHLAFPPPSPGQTKDIATAAITKMIGWTMGDSIKQGTELRRAAQEAILALFNLNTPQVTMRFSQLPKEYQEAAATLIHGRVRRSSNGGANQDIQSPPTSTPTSPVLMSGTLKRRHFLPTTETENLNPEEVYRSLRKTTAEIQNYSFESGRGKLTEQITTSQDSGISQMSPVDRLEEQMEQLALKSVPAQHLLPISPPSNSNTDDSSMGSNSSSYLTARDCNGSSLDLPPPRPANINHSAGQTLFAYSEQRNSLRVEAHSIEMDILDHRKLLKERDAIEMIVREGIQETTDAVRRIINALKTRLTNENETVVSDPRPPISEEELQAVLAELLAIMRDCPAVALLEQFKTLLRVLLGLVNEVNAIAKVLILGVLTEILKKKALTDNLNNYVELLILRVLNVFKDPNKDANALRAAEVCINTIALTLAPYMVVRVLAPLISIEGYPVNLTAIKMLTRVIEHKGGAPVINFLGDLMPGLIQAYDNDDSSVRKSAVFCMVALHSAVGEEILKPHLAALNGSKLKLLHLYIRRAQQSSSTPTSPRNQPPTSGRSS